MPLGSRGRGHSARTKIKALRGAPGTGNVEPLERRTLLSSGDLDPTFGDGGKVTGDIPGAASHERVRDIAVQSDGKIIEVAGHGGFGAGADAAFAVTRFNTDGSVDTSFGQNGLQVIRHPDRGMFFPSMAVASDDRIVIATWATDPPSDFLGADSDALVAVLNPDGSFDTSFDGDGIRTFDFGQAAGGPTAAKTADLVFGVAVQADGKVVTAGSISINNQGRFAVARLNRNGSLDTSFSGDGVATAPFGEYQSIANSVDVAPDGKILVGGQAGLLTGTPPRVTNQEFAVARYNPDGSLDATFDGDGWTVTPFSTFDDIVLRVKSAPGGKVVAAGSTAGGQTQDLALARYNADGTLDTTFSGDGKVIHGLSRRNSSGTIAPTSEQATGLAVQPDGSAVVITESAFPGFSNTLPQTWLVRFTPAGDADTSFGPDANGSVVVPELDEGLAVAIQPADGYIVAGGSVSNETSGFGDFGVVRFDPSGNLDGSFGPNFNGVATADFLDTGFNTPTAAAMQADGKVVIGGFSLVRNGNLRDITFARLNTDGSLDPTFGEGGIVRIDLAPGAGADIGERVGAVAIDPDGRIVFAGTIDDLANGGADDLLVGRLNPDGSLDSSFGFGTGMVTIAIGSNPAASETANDLVVQPDGKIVVVGEYAPSTTVREFLAVRLEPDGNLDTGFGPDFNGVHRIPVGTGNNATAEAVVVAPDQDTVGFDLVIAGVAVSTNQQFALVRLNENGMLDGLFGTGGKVTAFMTGATDAGAKDLVVDDQARLVAAGSARASSRDNFAVMRFTPFGALDTSFDTDGRNMTAFDGDAAVANSVVILPNGSILAGGTSANNFALARYNADGTLDTNFATAGKARTDFDPGFYPSSPATSRDNGVDLFVYPGDRAVLAGAGYPYRTGMDYAAARYVLTGPPNAVPTASIGGPYTVQEGAPTGLVISASATDPDGSIAKYEWDTDYRPVTGFVVRSRGTQVTIPPLADESTLPTRRVALRVTDDDGAVHFVETTVTTQNVTPVVDAGPDVNLPPNSHFFRTGSFTDPGADTWTATVDYGTGNGFVALPLAADKTYALDWHYADPGTYTITVRVRDNDGATGTDTVVVTVGQQANTVQGRQVFYNRSRFGSGPAAVATDKEVLLPGQAAGFRNVTSYSRGINGLLVTFRGDVTQLNADDFEFDVASEPASAAWADAPPPSGVTVSPGPALGTSVATVVWPDGAIRNQWLRVTVKPTANTRLAFPDVFYVGNLVGETGNNGAASPFVSPSDVGAVRARLFSRNRPITDAFDIDRDGAITAMDVLHVRRNVGRALPYFTAPAVPPAAAATFSDVALSSVTDDVLGAG